MLVPRAFVALIRDVKPVASESLTVDDEHLADCSVHHEACPGARAIAIMPTAPAEEGRSCRRLSRRSVG
jgi:hypothetical protein